MATAFERQPLNQRTQRMRVKASSSPLGEAEAGMSSDVPPASGVSWRKPLPSTPTAQMELCRSWLTRAKKTDLPFCREDRRNSVVRNLALIVREIGQLLEAGSVGGRQEEVELVVE